MRGMEWERWAAVSGLVALGVAGVAVSFERSTPNPDPSQAEVVDFGAIAAGATYVAGTLIGVGVSG